MSTASYAAYQGKPGKDYAKAVQKAVDKAEARRSR